jgi:Rrf2 family iron-sulfur cluster assembly transcriptional regulator
VDEPIDATQCGGMENCVDEHKCLTHDLWTSLNTHIFDYLKGVKLSRLVDEQVERVERMRAGAPAVVEMSDRNRGGKNETSPVSA